MSINQVRKAIIPAAGFGTRLFPATKVFKKEFFPIVDRDGRAKPIILLIVEEAISAGIEEIGIIIQNSDRKLFEEFFKREPQPELWQKLSPELREYSQYLLRLGEKVTFLIQEKQEGYGHAVFCAKDWVGNEPFVLLLGDHIYTSETQDSCTSQLVKLYRETGKTTIGLTVMPGEIINKAGGVTGVWQQVNSILAIDRLYEKPDLDFARSHLRIEGMPEDKFLAVFGIYVLNATIFNYLEVEINNNLRYKGEFQLTTSLDKLCQDEGAIGYLVKGQYYDVGMPEFYRQTMIDFGSTGI
jgi:UTP--glucose-1-phosphate uridylyltransferase